jgi:hypothetical protein
MVGPRPDRRNFYTTGVGGRRLFRQEAYENAVGDWERRRDEEGESRTPRSRERRIRDVETSSDRPTGILEAGNTAVDGEAAYYEDGGGTGQSGRRERYSGPNGPFGEGHHHDSSTDQGQTWDRWH